jgi:hypothetical protein
MLFLVCFFPGIDGEGKPGNTSVVETNEAMEGRGLKKRPIITVAIEAAKTSGIAVGNERRNGRGRRRVAGKRRVNWRDPRYFKRGNSSSIVCSGVFSDRLPPVHGPRQPAWKRPATWLVLRGAILKDLEPLHVSAKSRISAEPVASVAAPARDGQTAPWLHPSASSTRGHSDVATIHLWFVGRPLRLPRVIQARDALALQ